MMRSSRLPEDFGESDASDTSTDVSEGEFVVEKIVDSRIKNGKKEYLLKWKGYSE